MHETFNYTMTGRRDPTYLGVVFDIAKSQQQKPAIQKLTKESFLKGSDEFKLEEVIAEFERKGIDEKFNFNSSPPSLTLFLKKSE
jgi:hypothetical protein